MNFRTFIRPLIFLTAALATANAQPADGHLPVNNFAIGISTGHYGYDPAFRLDITSSAFIRNHFSLRLHAAIHGSEAYKSSTHHWASYQTIGLGMVYHTNIIDHARFFFELGALGILPDSRFSKKEYLQGIYQFNGLEVFFVNTGQYCAAFYLGVGPTFIKAYADKLERSPRYGNSVFYITGLRFYF